MRVPLLILLAVALPAVASESTSGQIDPAAFEQRFKSADKDKDGKFTASKYIDISEPLTFVV